MKHGWGKYIRGRAPAYYLSCHSLPNYDRSCNAATSAAGTSTRPSSRYLRSGSGTIPKRANRIGQICRRRQWLGVRAHAGRLPCFAPDEQHVRLVADLALHKSAPSPMSTRNCGHSNSAATEQRSKPVVRSVLRVPVERDHRFRWKMITQSGGT